MKENNNTPLVWNNIPEWAIFALEYGIEEELFLTDEDKDYPAFGKPCKTYEVTFITA